MNEAGPDRARSCARLTGALYLVIIVCGLFGEVVVRSGLVVRGDAAATAANLTGSAGLFRLGFAADLVAFLADVGVAALLYELLRPAGRTLALAAAGMRLVGTAVYGTNLLHHLAALQVLGADHLAAFSAGQRQDLALMFLDLHRLGYDLGLVFFGVHCLLLGPLLRRSDRFPGVLGVLMTLAGLVYVAGSFMSFLAPGHAASVAPAYAVPLVAELALCLWLLVRGVRTAPAS